MKKNAIFILSTLIILILLFALSRKEFPPIPVDDDHVSADTVESCQACHGPEKEHPLKESHPPKFSCLKCHTPSDTSG